MKRFISIDFWYSLEYCYFGTLTKKKKEVRAANLSLVVVLTIHYHVYIIVKQSNDYEMDKYSTIVPKYGYLYAYYFILWVFFHSVPGRGHRVQTAGPPLNRPRRVSNQFSPEDLTAAACGYRLVVVWSTIGLPESCRRCIHHVSKVYTGGSSWSFAGSCEDRTGVLARVKLWPPRRPDRALSYSFSKRGDGVLPALRLVAYASSCESAGECPLGFIRVSLLWTKYQAKAYHGIYIRICF